MITLAARFSASFRLFKEAVFRYALKGSDDDEHCGIMMMMMMMMMSCKVC